jgi:transcriptional regulator with XRE-family HTH domain
VDHLPFAQLIAEARERRDLSLHGVARGMCEAAREEGTYCGTTRQSIHSYERGRIPYRDAMRWLAAALDLPLEDLRAAARRQRRYRLGLRLVGSVGGLPGEAAYGTLDKDVERRDLLALMGRAATAGLLTSTLGRLPAVASPRPVDADAIEAATAVARSYHRLWLTTPTEDLRPVVLGHLRLVARLLASATSEKDQATLAAAAADTALLAALLAQDSWDPGAVQRHFQEARSHAERSQYGDLQALVASSMSMWAARGTGSGPEAVRLAREARRLLPPGAPPAAHAHIATREAIAHAAARDEPAMSSALLRAEGSLDKTDESSGPTWPWVFSVDHREITRFRGLAAVSLRLPAMAVPALSEGLEHLGTAPSKRRAYTLSKLAQAHCQTGDVEQACDLGAQAFTIATQLGATESLMAVRDVRVQLIPVETSGPVRAFDDRMLSTLLTLPR